VQEEQQQPSGTLAAGSSAAAAVPSTRQQGSRQEMAPALQQSLMRQVPLQQPPPVPGGTGLTAQFLAEQGRSYATPFEGVMPAMISHAPALGQYQPHIGHVLGAAATAQRMMQSQAWQQQVGLLQPPMLPQPPGLLQPQMILHSQMLFPEQQGGTLGGLTYPTATDGSFSYGMPGGRFMPAEAMAGEGGGQQKQQLECSSRGGVAWQAGAGQQWQQQPLHKQE
jgi:hypothetical protein